MKCLFDFFRFSGGGEFPDEGFLRVDVAEEFFEVEVAC